jgi:hypothetical protein
MVGPLPAQRNMHGKWDVIVQTRMVTSIGEGSNTEVSGVVLKQSGYMIVIMMIAGSLQCVTDIIGRCGHVHALNRTLSLLHRNTIRARDND